ncbi:uncharacterized protein LOC124788701 [Schistocerca piceifrons]|uniref:uncharacterized protein LOC124788701 n=1 Tax=Schistocerca piceifrons TaxID=274613 RepID=UPI001F5ED52E|nr:uncharacterized protein LOC124788701 [Schistocerca piceifrons]
MAAVTLDEGTVCRKHTNQLRPSVVRSQRPSALGDDSAPLLARPLPPSKPPVTPQADPPAAVPTYMDVPAPVSAPGLLAPTDPGRRGATAARLGRRQPAPQHSSSSSSYTPAPTPGTMRTSLALMLALAAILTTHLAAAGPYLDDPVPDDGVEDYSDGNLERLLQGAQQNEPESFSYGGEVSKREPARRACIRRGGTCDHRPKDCCYNSSCRCNLWGANCRCQRMGLFQKWGK